MSLMRPFVLQQSDFLEAKPEISAVLYFNPNSISGTPDTYNQKASLTEITNIPPSKANTMAALG